jgi:hypothetical protein
MFFQTLEIDVLVTFEMSRFFLDVIILSNFQIAVNPVRNSSEKIFFKIFSSIKCAIRDLWVLSSRFPVFFILKQIFNGVKSDLHNFSTS